MVCTSGRGGGGYSGDVRGPGEGSGVVATASLLFDTAGISVRRVEGVGFEGCGSGSAVSRGTEAQRRRNPVGARGE